jgi:hypothetical protein
MSGNLPASHGCSRWSSALLLRHRAATAADERYSAYAALAADLAPLRFALAHTSYATSSPSCESPAGTTRTSKRSSRREGWTARACPPGPRTHSKDPRRIAHYTTAAAVFGHILPEQQLRMSPRRAGMKRVAMCQRDVVLITVQAPATIWCQDPPLSAPISPNRPRPDLSSFQALAGICQPPCRFSHTREVAGSNPAAPIILSAVSGSSSVTRKSRLTS